MSAKARGYQHGEAFSLMHYRSKVSGVEEVLWNSRDGVTPFIIPSTDWSHSMEHVRWEDDRCVPTYVPAVGMRIFVDASEDTAHADAVRLVDLRPEIVVRQFAGNRRRAIKTIAHQSLTAHGPGTPAIVEVTTALRVIFAMRCALVAESGGMQ